MDYNILKTGLIAMTRTPHDRFAKDCLEELLKSLGKFPTPLEVKDEPRQIAKRAWLYRIHLLKRNGPD